VKRGCGRLPVDADPDAEVAEPAVEVVEAGWRLGDVVLARELSLDDIQILLSEPVLDPPNRGQTGVLAGAGDHGGRGDHLDPEVGVAVEQLSLVHAQALCPAGLTATQDLVRVREGQDRLVEAGDVTYDGDAHLGELAQGLVVVGVEPVGLVSLGEGEGHARLAGKAGRGQAPQHGRLLGEERADLVSGVDLLAGVGVRLGPDDHVAGLQVEVLGGHLLRRHLLPYRDGAQDRLFVIGRGGGGGEGGFFGDARRLRGNPFGFTGLEVDDPGSGLRRRGSLVELDLGVLGAVRVDRVLRHSGLGGGGGEESEGEGEGTGHGGSWDRVQCAPLGWNRLYRGG